MLLLVQLLQVWSIASVYARPSGCEPVRMSCWFGMSPTPFTMRLLLGQRELLAKRVAEARLIDRVAVKLRDVPATSCPRGVVPRPVADAVAGVDGAGALRAQIGVPGRRRAASGRGRQLLALRVGAGEAAVVRAVALPTLVMKKDIGGGGPAGPRPCPPAGACASTRYSSRAARS